MKSRRSLQERIYDAVECVIGNEPDEVAHEAAVVIMEAYLLSQIRLHGDGCVLDIPERIVGSWTDDDTMMVEFVEQNGDVFWSWDLADHVDELRSRWAPLIMKL